MNDFGHCEGNKDGAVVDFSVIGIGSVGQKALGLIQQPADYEMAALSVSGTEEFCRRRDEVAALCPWMIVLADLNDTSTLSVLMRCGLAHRHKHNDASILICIVPAYCEPLISDDIQELYDCFIFVDTERHTLADPVNMLFRYISNGIFSMDMPDVLAVLRSMPIMNFIEFSAETKEGLLIALNEKGLFPMKRVGNQSALVLLELDEAFGLDAAEAVGVHCYECGYEPFLYQAAFCDGQYEHKLKMSLLAGNTN